MSSYQGKVLQTASQILPDWPKKPTQFYVAILPYNVAVPICQHADFFWLKCGGRTTIANLRKAYIAQSEISVELVYGNRIKPQDDTQIRNLHARSDIVVFWTIVNTTEVLCLDVHPNFWAVAKKMQAIWAGRASPWDLMVSESRLMPAIGLSSEHVRTQKKSEEQRTDKVSPRHALESLQKHVSRLCEYSKVIAKPWPAGSRWNFTSVQFGCYDCGYFSPEQTEGKRPPEILNFFRNHLMSKPHQLKIEARVGQAARKLPARLAHEVLEYLQKLFKTAQLEIKVNSGCWDPVPGYTIECLKCRNFAYKFSRYDIHLEAKAAYEVHRGTIHHNSFRLDSRKNATEASESASALGLPTSRINNSSVSKSVKKLPSGVRNYSSLRSGTNSQDEIPTSPNIKSLSEVSSRADTSHAIFSLVRGLRRDQPKDIQSSDKATNQLQPRRPPANLKEQDVNALPTFPLLPSTTPSPLRRLSLGRFEPTTASSNPSSIKDSPSLQDYQKHLVMLRNEFPQDNIRIQESTTPKSKERIITGHCLDCKHSMHFLGNPEVMYASLRTHLSNNMHLVKKDAKTRSEMRKQALSASKINENASIKDALEAFFTDVDLDKYSRKRKGVPRLGEAPMVADSKDLVTLVRPVRSKRRKIDVGKS